MVLVLASGSPRRRELLTSLGLEFVTADPRVDETLPLDSPPEAGVVAIAWRKVDAALKRHEADSISTSDHLLAADTIVVHEGRVYGKPETAATAKTTLRSLSGKTHSVMTGIALRSPEGRRFDACEVTEVTLDALSDTRIDSYVSTGEPLDKAGAYAIQGRGASLVAGIRGDYFNVVGLPLRRTLALLQEAAYPLPSHLRLHE